MQAVTLTSASPAVASWTAHGLMTGQKLWFAGAPVPTGMSASTDYFVRWASANTFTLSSVNTGSVVTVSIASPGVVSWPAHGFSANDQLLFGTNGALPTGLTASNNGAAVPTYYFVKTVLDANTFTVSATSGGAVINTTGTQSGTHIANKHAPVNTTSTGTSVTCEGQDPITYIGSGAAPLLAAGQVTISNVPLAVTLTLVNLISGSDVVIVLTGTSTELVAVDGNPSTSYYFSHKYAGTAVDICVLKSGRVPFYIRNYTLPMVATSLPIAQVADRNYA